MLDPPTTQRKIGTESIRWVDVQEVERLYVRFATPDMTAGTVVSLGCALTTPDGVNMGQGGRSELS